MRVAITGSSGFIGSRLVAQLAQDPQVETIVGLDLNPPRETHAKLVFVKQDVTQPMDAHFAAHKIDAGVHLAFIVDPMHDERRMSEINLKGTENFIRACEASGVKTIVAASSGTAYGAHADNPPALVEGKHPLRGNPEYLYSHDKMTMERLFDAFSAKHPDAKVGILRPSIVLGPHVSNFISRMVKNRVMYAFRDATPPWQFVHEDDVARAFQHALLKGLHGAYNIGGAGSITLDEINRLAGNKLIKFPAWLMHTAITFGWLLHLKTLTEAPAGILPFIRYPWVVDPAKFVATGFKYEFDTRAALMAFLETAGLLARDAVGAT